MSYAVPRAVVEAFYQAYVSRNPVRIGAFLDDHVQWQVFGPIEIMQVCGEWCGKAAVIERFAHVAAQVIEFKCLDKDCLLVDGDCSAMFGRITSRQRSTGRMISHRVAHFARYRDEKVVSFRCINDSLDAAEQFIGHHINLSAKADSSEADLVVV